MRSVAVRISSVSLSPALARATGDVGRLVILRAPIEVLYLETRRARAAETPHHHQRQAPVGTAALHGRGEDEAAQKAPAAPSCAKSSEGSQLPGTLTYSSPVSRTPASSLGGRRGAIAASRGRDRFAPDSPHRQAVGPISTGRRRGRVFRTVSGGFAGVGAPRDARDVRIAPHYRSRSRLSISGGSGCADGFLVGVPFTLQWPPWPFAKRSTAKEP